MGWVVPVRVCDGPADAGVLILCDHASNAVPAPYGRLGLDEAQFERHIAYDVGAAEVTHSLAAALRAPAVMTCFSRLLIDPNRGMDDPTLVMRLSDGAVIPANASIDHEEIARRVKNYWQPYRDAVRAQIDLMCTQGPLPALVSIHSFTPHWKGHSRPWEVGILWDRDPRLAVPLMRDLRAQGVCVGDNEPYDGALEGDTLYEHGTQRGLAHVLIEVRQDLIARRDEAQAWGQRLAHALMPLLAQPELHEHKFYGSRSRMRLMK
jgi:predicted N-formylglutamate amidohydrolase